MTQNIETVGNGAIRRWKSEKKFGFFGNMIQHGFHMFDDFGNRTDFHLVYDAPYNFNFYSNVLTMMVCDNAKCPESLFAPSEGPNWLRYTNCKST